MRVLILLFSTIFILAGCASVPQSVSGENFAQISVPQARTNPEQAKNANVRWGGIIVEVINNETETWIEVLAMPLGANSKPKGDRQLSQGRFIAKTPEFLDPQVFQKGLSITFVGTVSSTLEGKVGERPYVYPILAVKAHYLWQRVMNRNYRYIAPGYWYYGFHPFWRFGYPFYGYGVWHYDSFYPYYPVYGFLDRSNRMISRASGDFSFSANSNWPRIGSFYWQMNSGWYNGYRNIGYRNNGYRNKVPNGTANNYQRNNQVYKPTRNTSRNNRTANTGRNYQSRPVSPKRAPRQTEK